MMHTRLTIDGMTCASCVGRVERALASTPGVMDANVNLATESADISFDAPADIPKLTQVLADAGYPARVETVTLDVQGMTCASCVGHVERALKDTDGVVAAEVNLATETAQVSYLAGQIAPHDMLKVTERAGYPATLHAEDATPTDRKADEARALLRHFLISAALTFPVFAVEMGGHLVPPFHHWFMVMVPPSIWLPIQLTLITAVLFWPGRVFFAKGLPALRRGAPDMNALVAMGAGSAYLYSCVVVFAPILLPETARDVYFEAAGVIVTLILMGRYFEARAKGRTGAAIRKLAGLKPRTASVMRDGMFVNVPVEEVDVGDVLSLKPGEKIAVDGVVLSGESHVDESMMSGEPIPVAKAEGAALIAGTVNGEGALRYQAEKVGRDTILAQIIRMVEDAQGAKLPIQSLVDRVTMYFVPVVIAVAILTVLVWMIFGPEPTLQHALVAGVCVLIIACPCAMGLATPTSIMVGTGRAAELGVLFRKGDALQALQGIKVIGFDKTGTLTEGRPDVTDVILLDAGGLGADGLPDEDGLFAMVAAAESLSEHPIARAIERAAHLRGLVLPDVTKLRALAGHGLRADLGETRLLIGTKRLMLREHVETDAFETAIAPLVAQGRTPVLVAVNGQPAMVIAVSDAVRPQAREAIDALHARGIKVAMITGDTRASAQVIAAELGIDDIQAEILPKGKADAVAALRAAHGSVGYVGDGINDAPALAAADVGVAVGTGTDVAIESADVVLMGGDPRAVVTAFDISQHVIRNIRQNLFWAFAYNVALIPLAAGVLYPFFDVLLSPMIGAGAMALSSVFVVSNALRLRSMKSAF